MGDDNIRALFTDSEVQMAQVIAGLLQGQTVKEVAASAGVPAGRIIRWYRDSERFMEMLTDVSSEVVEEIRSTIKADMRESIVNLLPKASEVLESSLDSEKENVALAAAAHVFRLAGYDRKDTVTRQSPPARAPQQASPAAGD